MAWTAPRTWTTSELVTAAFMNTHVRDNLTFINGKTGEYLIESKDGFTNTSFADLDALTAQPFSGPVSVTVETGTTAIVIVSAVTIAINTSGICIMSYRVSGASTINSSDSRGIRTDGTAEATGGFTYFEDALTAGTNTFELQARVSANSGAIRVPSLVVIPVG